MQVEKNDEKQINILFPFEYSDLQSTAAEIEFVTLKARVAFVFERIFREIIYSRDSATLKKFRYFLTLAGSK